MVLTIFRYLVWLNVEFCLNCEEFQFVIMETVDMCALVIDTQWQIYIQLWDYSVPRCLNAFSVTRNILLCRIHFNQCLMPSGRFLCVGRCHQLSLRLTCFIRPVVQFPRCATSGVRGAESLVLNCLLWTQQSRGRGLPRLVNQCAGGRLHRPFQQQEPLLPRPAVQRQPQLDNREHPQTHRQRYDWQSHAAERRWGAHFVPSVLCIECPDRWLSVSVHQESTCTMWEGRCTQSASVIPAFLSRAVTVITTTASTPPLSARSPVDAASRFSTTRSLLSFWPSQSTMALRPCMS